MARCKFDALNLLVEDGGPIVALPQSTGFDSRRRPKASNRGAGRAEGALNGLPETKRATDAFSESVFSELRAVRTEVSTLRDLLNQRAGGGAAAEEILTRGQVAELLGICVETVTNLTKPASGAPLPCRRVGKEYRFLKSEVISWLAAGGDARLPGEG